MTRDRGAARQPRWTCSIETIVRLVAVTPTTLVERLRLTAVSLG